MYGAPRNWSGSNIWPSSLRFGHASEMTPGIHLSTKSWCAYSASFCAVISGDVRGRPPHSVAAWRRYLPTATGQFSMAGDI